MYDEFICLSSVLSLVAKTVEKQELLFIAGRYAIGTTIVKWSLATS